MFSTVLAKLFLFVVCLPQIKSTMVSTKYGDIEGVESFYQILLDHSSLSASFLEFHSLHHRLETSDSNHQILHGNGNQTCVKLNNTATFAGKMTTMRSSFEYSLKILSTARIVCTSISTAQM